MLDLEHHPLVGQMRPVERLGDDAVARRPRTRRTSAAMSMSVVAGVT